jgi:hypothetical protein
MEQKQSVLTLRQHAERAYQVYLQALERNAPALEQARLLDAWCTLDRYAMNDPDMLIKA